MAETADLSQISNAIRTSMGEFLIGFRQAAADNNNNLTRVVKDIARSFADQRKEIASLSNTIEQDLAETEQLSAKVSTLTSIFQESVSVQTTMLGELKSLTSGVKILNDSTEQLNNSIIGGGNSVTGLLGGILRAFDFIPGAFKAAVAGLTLGAVGSSAYNLMGGGGKDGTFKESNEFFNSIIKAEGTDKQGDPYNTSLGYMKSPKPLTEMTMDESLAWGEQVRKTQGLNSSAKGAFQIVNSTQRDAMKALGLSGSDKFNEENQKKMASWIARNQGLGAWEGFKVHPEQRSIAQQAMSNKLDQQTAAAQITQTNATSAVTPNAITPQNTPGSGILGEGHGIISSAANAGSVSAVAEKFVGKSESNAKRELESFIGTFHHSIDIQKTPWCAAFVNSVLGSKGYPGTGSDSARSFLNYGGTVWDRTSGQGDLSKAQEGDIAVFNRDGKGHVGIVKSVSGDSITIIGGNQSDSQSGGQVSIATRNINTPGSELLSIRRPDGTSVATSPGGGVSSPSQSISQQAMAGAVSAPLSPMTQQMLNTSISNLTGGGMMGGMGNIGGMMGGAGSMIGALTPAVSGIIGSMSAPQLSPVSQQVETPAQIINNNAQTEISNQIQEAAVTKQAQAEMSQEYNAFANQPQQVAGADVGVAPNAMHSSARGYDYNHPGDTSWPEWASILGHIGFQELSKIKLWG